MSRFCAPSSAVANSALFLFYFFGVPAEKRGNSKWMQRWQMERECVDQDKTKAETRASRRGRRGGEKKKNRDRNKVYVSGWPLRWFSISAGQREWANMIFSSAQQTENRQRGHGVRWQEKGIRGGGKRGEKGKKRVNGKKMQKWGVGGGYLIGLEIKEQLWEGSQQGMQSIYNAKLKWQHCYLKPAVRLLLHIFPSCI